MPISKQIIADAAQVTVLAEKLERLIFENYKFTVPNSVWKVVTSIPVSMAKSQSVGANFAIVMKLREWYDFSAPSRLERLRGMKPQPDRLQPNAKAVFNYCLHCGLQPQLSRCERNSKGELTSEISIEWSAHQLAAAHNKSSDTGSDFLLRMKNLKRVTNLEPEPLVLSSRVFAALELLPEIIHRIERADFNGRTSCKVIDKTVAAETLGLTESPMVKAPDLVLDIKWLCELLGLTARMDECFWRGTSGNSYCTYSVDVSGW